MTENKPCPFCGSENVKIVNNNSYVECEDCNAYGPTPKGVTFDTQREIAISLVWDAWNKRIEIKGK